MDELLSVMDAWVDNARAKLRRGALAEEDLELLQTTLHALAHPRRQRLLYLHTREPVVSAEVIAWAEHPGEDPGALPVERPYATVQAAMQDGWQAIHFPQQLAPFDDREVDIIGYEFILQKSEAAGG
jgi:hypothetical protein